MLSISKSVKGLVWATLCVISLTCWAEPTNRNLIAKVGTYEITHFEVSSFINKVLPIGTFHTTSINKKDYHDKAVQQSIESSLLLLYIEQNNPNMHHQLETQVHSDIETIQSKAGSIEKYNQLLNQSGISEKDLINTRMKLSVKDLYKETFMNKKTDEKVLKDYYQHNADMFMTGASADIKTCLIKADARNLSQKEMKQKKVDAQATVFKLKEGHSSFNDTACDTEIYPKQHRIYRFSKGYPAKRILQMEEGSISDPIKSIYGFLIVKIEKRFESEKLPYTEVKEQIEDIMTRKAFQNNYNQIIKDMKNEVVVQMLDPQHSS